MPKLSTLTFTWTGAWFFKSWHLLRHNPPAVRYAYQNPWHQEWQSAAISSVCHVSFATCIRQTIPSPSPRKKPAGRNAQSAGIVFTCPKHGLSVGSPDRRGKNLEKVVMWFSGSSCGNREAPSRYLEMALMRLQRQKTSHGISLLKLPIMHGS